MEGNNGHLAEESSARDQWKDSLARLVSGCAGLA